MAKRAAKTKAPAAPATPRQHSLVWVQGLLCGAMVTLAPPTALLIAALLWPAMVAYVLDGLPGRPKARSVALCGLAASVTPLRALWASGHTMAGATAIASNLPTLGIAWSGAAAGWLLAEIVPVAIRMVLEALSLTRAAHLRSTREKLIEEWGFHGEDERG